MKRVSRRIFGLWGQRAKAPPPDLPVSCLTARRTRGGDERRHGLLAVGLASLLVAAGCGDAGGEPGAEATSWRAEQQPDPLPYAAELVAFEPGPAAGYGQDELPDVVLGPPQGNGRTQGATEGIVSLGVGGEIVVGFGDRAIVDAPGPDFLVFENPFFVQGDPAEVWAELGEVSVSEDGERWVRFDCDTTPTSPGRWPGCAGWRPVLDYDASAMHPLEPALTGGDAFDLADVGLSEARYVRIRDLSDSGVAPSAGFDLDAVGLIHWEAR